MESQAYVEATQEYVAKRWRGKSVSKEADVFSEFYYVWSVWNYYFF